MSAAVTVNPNQLKRKESMSSSAGDKLDITPLGAGNEVGRSCVYMTYKGKTVLVRSSPARVLLMDFWFSARRSSPSC
jgi:predicted metal-dependent RNase